MGAVLRASGPEFEVAPFVEGCHWHINRIYRKGDARRPWKSLDERRESESGLVVAVSDADFHEFERQLDDAVAFLVQEGAEVQRLVAFPGVAGVELDFGIAWQETFTQTDHLPARLVRLAGDCGIALTLSHYPIADAATTRANEEVSHAHPTKTLAAEAPREV